METPLHVCGKPNPNLSFHQQKKQYTPLLQSQIRRKQCGKWGLPFPAVISTPRSHSKDGFLLAPRRSTISGKNMKQVKIIIPGVKMVEVLLFWSSGLEPPCNSRTTELLTRFPSILSLLRMPEATGDSGFLSRS